MGSSPSSTSDPATWNNTTTGDQVMEKVDLSGKTAIVTGANSGLGLETARVLVSCNCRVVLACRSGEKGNNARAEIVATFPNDKQDNIRNLLIPMILELSSLKSVYNFAKNVYDKIDKCHFLINNAGIMALPKFQTTTEGFEKQFGVNHVGHQYLTILLTDLLLKSKPARVICLSSLGHAVAGPKDVSEWLPVFIHEKRGPKESNYGDYKVYGISKSCNILFAREYNNRFYDKGIAAFSVHPGGIQTNLNRDTSCCADLGFICNSGACCCCCGGLNLMKEYKSIPQGVSTTLRCVQLTKQEVHQYNGHYFADCQSNETTSLRKDHRRSKQMDKWVKEFYDLTNELIQTKGFSLTIQNNNQQQVQQETVQEEEQKEN